MEVYRCFSLDTENTKNVREFMGSCVALLPNDDYLSMPYGESIIKVKHPKLEKNPKWRNNSPSCEIIMKAVNYCRKRNKNHQKTINILMEKYISKIIKNGMKTGVL